MYILRVHSTCTFYVYILCAYSTCEFDVYLAMLLVNLRFQSNHCPPKSNILPIQTSIHRHIIRTTICHIIRRLCSGFLVSYRIQSAMEFPQNVLYYIWHTSRVYVIHIKSLSRYFQLTQNWTDKAKWRSIEASNNVNKHTGHGLLAVDSPPE